MIKNRINIIGRFKFVLMTLLMAALLLGNSIKVVACNSEIGCITQQEEIYQLLDKKPKFKGGETGLEKFLKENVKYPAIARENGVQGRVIVEFIIEKNGSITNAKIIKGVDPHLNNEALRVVNLMPKWKPGKHKGKKVRVRYSMPILFRLT
ncbi:MAG: energy transducer TonB [Bacteroidaceae bacterium]|nr:energy transducer TonB [Bacteroidaceae bacterium]